MNTPLQTIRYGAAALIIAALGVCSLPQAQAQTEAKPQPQAQPQKPQKAPDTPASVRGGHFYAFGGFAALAADTNSQFQNEKGSPVNLIAGGGYGVSPNLAVELNVLLAARKLDTPQAVQTQLGGPLAYAGGTDKTSMGAFGVGATLKYIFLLDNFAPYLGGGFGLYTTTYLTRTDAIGCSNNCAGTGPRVSDHSTDIGAHALVGADIHFSAKNILGIEIRYLKLKADLGDINLGKVDSGGTFFWMGYRRIF
jgi:opacity protein-like surface antigen